MSSLPTALEALARHGIAALVAVDATVEDDPRLYHGPPPADLTCADGAVYVWWEPLTAPARCAAPQPVVAVVRWTRCWPVEPTYVPEHSDVATELADGAWVLHQAYLGLACDRTALAVPDEDSPFYDSGVASVKVLTTRARTPAQGAGVEVRLELVAALEPTATSSGS